MRAEEAHAKHFGPVCLGRGSYGWSSSLKAFWAAAGERPLRRHHQGRRSSRPERAAPASRRTLAYNGSSARPARYALRPAASLPRLRWGLLNEAMRQIASGSGTLRSRQPLAQVWMICPSFHTNVAAPPMRPALVKVSSMAATASGAVVFRLADRRDSDTHALVRPEELAGVEPAQIAHQLPDKGRVTQILVGDAL